MATTKIYFKDSKKSFTLIFMTKTKRGIGN